ncbi:MAG TPA: NAD(P)-dependent oxidoreductase [Methylomusa anaerophila]|uniref:GDP-6-deoxy-D-talose 4-dehydrogenase n=1 Tax=Methylomusa anaerophila TaxID=1930071 RepID=A0A348AGC7_9FIRM|nr:NAD(P)-dependent oxidoreductase [Methylomusa anaerophila]BBB90125.1 GDP-6-deoxy-D-talose 4-dehydrogenase [Methylomusa anaerophila]HML88151.1 NAD(P)-dependent oxidoreductase [Methylomusa anaerophila]
MKEYILVTGCNGFIGRAIVSRLLACSRTILGISIEQDSSVKDAGFTYQQADITNHEAVHELFLKYNITAVVHLAAIAQIKEDNARTWEQYYKVNYLASCNLFEWAAKFGAKVIFSSTVDVYGQNDKAVLSEEDICMPISNYAKSKHMAEIALTQIADTHSMDYVIFRFAPVYSEELMNNVYKRIYIKKYSLAYVIGKGGQEFHFCSLNNAVNAVAVWLDMPQPVTGVVNICDQNKIAASKIITNEKAMGRARYVVHVPRALLVIMHYIVRRALAFIRKLSFLHNIFRKLLKPSSYSNVKYISTMGYSAWDMNNAMYFCKGGLINEKN